jgi:group I intron endonuclease
MGILYKLTFSSGKAYIGVTRRRLSARMQDHRKRAGRTRKDEKFAIYEAWRKYGEPVVEILAVVENEDLAAAEIRAIELFRTLSPNGYNLTLGGDGVRTGRKVSEETKEKLRIANLGKKQSLETRKRRSEALTGRICSEDTRRKIGEKNRINSLGKSPSAHTRKLLSEASKGRTHSVSEEARARMSAAKKGKSWTEAQRNARRNLTASTTRIN